MALLGFHVIPLFHGFSLSGRSASTGFVGIWYPDLRKGNTMLIKVDEAPQGWSYMAVDYETSESTTDPNGWLQKDALGVDYVDLHGSLLNLGDEGWELVSVVPFLIGTKTKFKAIFKRPQFVTEAGPAPKDYRMNLGDLRANLELFPDDYEVTFGSGNLKFYRTKQRGDKLVQIEFSPDEP